MHKSSRDPVNKRTDNIHEHGKRDLEDMDSFLRAFQKYSSFSYIKINHGFWEAISDVYKYIGNPVPEDRYKEADKIARRPYFFKGGFVDELLVLLKNAVENSDEALFMGFELSAWPGDNSITGTPFYPERSIPVLEEVIQGYNKNVDGLLLKRAVMSGEILEFFDIIRPMHVLLVGPGYIKPLLKIAKLPNSEFIPIHVSEARRKRFRIEKKIESFLKKNEGSDRVVLLQAGTLAPYWILRLRENHPGVRWVDGGLAFSIGSPDDILKRPWGKTYREQIITTYEKMNGPSDIPKRLTLPIVADNRPSREGSAKGKSNIAFVERKELDFERVDAFLASARENNYWANRGWAWEMLGTSYHHFFRQPRGLTVTACANGGVALTALAQMHACRIGRALRWVVSAFGFYNTIRGVFADSHVLDCDAHGMLSLDELSALDKDCYDGIVVTNPFGIAENFDPYIEFARRNKKTLLIDNAAGIKQNIPDHPYQAFSLHHTKPFGFGEGGLILAPEKDTELLLGLLEYSNIPQSHEPYWVGNGKISELSCAALLSRLETYPEWSDKYKFQSRRIQKIAERAGLTRLFDYPLQVIATSLPFLTKVPVSLDALSNEHFTIGRYYKPLRPLPTAVDVYSRIINVPSHPDMRHVETTTILDVLSTIGEKDS
jgi:dTDP-4-amino-4,6-dideoxygalactose transaminase